MYERRNQPLVPRRVFYHRLGRSLAAGSVVIVVALFIGMAGYHGFERLSWLDAFLNAAMILSGMGPVAPIQTTGGKLFAGCYAIFSGFALLTAAGVVFAPVIHRFLHKFHLEGDARGKQPPSTPLKSVIDEQKLAR